MQPIRVRIKVGGTVVHKLASRPSGENASAGAAGPSSQHVSRKAKKPLSAAARKRRLLKGYPEPGTLPNALVAFLRQGPAPLLPPWDSELALPASCPVSEDGLRPLKRQRTETDAPCAMASEPSRGAWQQQQQQPCTGESLPGAAPCIQQKPGVPLVHDMTQQLVDEHCDDQHKAGRELQHQANAQGSGSSSSEHATTSLFPSPPEVSAQPIASHPSPQQELQRPLLCSTAPARQSGVASTSAPGCAVQAGMASILPPSFLQLQGACSSIASIFSAVTTAELQVPQTAPPSQSSEKMVESRLQAAKACKHEADQARGSKGWSTRTVIKYVEAALLFIEACEYLVRVPGENKQQISRASLLYIQTSDFLQYTVRAVETLNRKDEVVPREVLRTLCERLAAICLMRESVLQPAKYSDCARRMEYLLNKSQQQQQQAAAAGTTQAAQPAQAAGGRVFGGKQAGASGKEAGGQQQQTSPNDSTTSSQDHMDVTQPAPQPAPTAAPRAQHPLVNVSQELGRLQPEVMQSVKQITQYGGLMRRSTLGFQALLERADVQSSQTAKRACIHLASLCLDMGMVSSVLTLVGQARQVVSCVRGL